MKLPPLRIAGSALEAASRATRTPLGARAAYGIFQGTLHLERLESLTAPPPRAFDPAMVVVPGAPVRNDTGARLALPTAPWGSNLRALTEAYQRRTLTPLQVLKTVLEGQKSLASRTPAMGPFWELCEASAHREAEASTARYAAGTPLGPWDGVPVAIKEELSVRGLSRQAGTRCFDGTPQDADATAVERLRGEGALVVGTTVMTEYGFSPIGFNRFRPMPRNPHDPRRTAGGSSTGSAVAVATGLVPFALGGDGGGSVRIPAALTGIFGLKPTWGRVSRFGSAYTGSLEHVGVFASCTEDIATSLELLGPPDPRDPYAAQAPVVEPGSFTKALGWGLRGRRIGYFENALRDVDAPMAHAFEGLLRSLEKEGVTWVPLPSTALDISGPLGVITFAVDCGVRLMPYAEKDPDAFADDIQVILAAVSRVTAKDYLRAQALRTSLREETARLFREVDALVLPTTATVAPPVTEGEFAQGFIDSALVEKLCRFNFLGNLTGFPAASVPWGTTDEGVPFGLQIMGDAWDEAMVLSMAAHLERLGLAKAFRPKIAVDLR